jgi:hypothetical protein
MPKVVFYKDNDNEMLRIEVDGKHFIEGDFWDFDFANDCEELLQMLGIEVELKNYIYGE